MASAGALPTARGGWWASGLTCCRRPGSLGPEVDGGGRQSLCGSFGVGGAVGRFGDPSLDQLIADRLWHDAQPEETVTTTVDLPPVRRAEELIAVVDAADDDLAGCGVAIDEMNDRV